MVTTADGARIGQVTWRAVIVWDDGTEVWARMIAEHEVPAARRIDAEHFAQGTLARQRPPKTGRNWAHVQRGRYVDASFEAEVYGEYVTDGTWEPDEVDGGYVGTYYWQASDGTVEAGPL